MLDNSHRNERTRTLSIVWFFSFQRGSRLTSFNSCYHVSSKNIKWNCSRENHSHVSVLTGGFAYAPEGHSSVNTGCLMRLCVCGGGRVALWEIISARPALYSFTSLLWDKRQKQREATERLSRAFGTGLTQTVFSSNTFVHVQTNKLPMECDNIHSCVTLHIPASAASSMLTC